MNTATQNLENDHVHILRLTDVMLAMVLKQSVDTIHFELRATTAPFAVQHSATGVVNSSGYVDFVFPPSLWQQSYYMVVKHRNSIETWSKTPFYIPQGVQSFSLTDSFTPITYPDNFDTE